MESNEDIRTKDVMFLLHEQFNIELSENYDYNS